MRKIKHTGQKLTLAVMLMTLLILSTQAFSQSTRGSISGTVQDSSKAVLQGAVVNATNVDTGIKSTSKTNNAGTYNIAGLQPGIYKVTAEMPGFQTATRTDIKLNANSQVRLDLELAVGVANTEIEVTSSAESLILESGSSTGTVMGEKVVTELPLVGNNVMELVNVMGGVVRPTGDSVFGNASQTFAGVASGNVNVQRDGITVSDVRFSSGIVSPGQINPEMIGEFKMVLSPVDAEMGRGAGQVQMLTKSGSNAFHGSGVWANQNSGIDANEWENNRLGVKPNYTNVNEYTISASGPIIKNKTFFFATWDQNIVLMKMLVRAQTLTNCARKGIYRYFSGWIPGSSSAQTTLGAGTNVRPSVTATGEPLVPTTDRSGGAYTGTGPISQYPGLNFQSVLGQLSQTARAQILSDPVNCSNYLPGGLSADASLGAQQTANGIAAGTNWDPLRSGVDTTGYISRFTTLMPQGNEFYQGDGLNVNNLRWVRRVPGQDTVYGTGMNNQRKSITVKLDHNLANNHRLSGTFSYEKDLSGSAEEVWPKPKGYPGSSTRNPWTFTTSVTSTLSSTLLNEFRFGLASNEMHNVDPTMGPDASAMKDLLKKLMPTSSFPNWKDNIVAVGPGAGDISFNPDTTSMPLSIGPIPGNPAMTGSMSNPLGGRNDLEATWGDLDRRWTLGDTVTWAHGKHSFKGGVEVRLTRSQQDTNGWAQFTNSSNTYPYVQGGNTGIPGSEPKGIDANWIGMTGTNGGTGSSGTYLGAYNLMNYMAGSVGQIRQFYFVNNPKALTWNDPAKGELTRLTDLRQKEMSVFFKDDWKVTSDLTLNLGIRWDYFGIPYTGNGLTAGLKGGATSIFGGSQGGLATWLKNPTYNAATETVQTFIGPGSPNPNQSVYNKDLNNFGPAVGFAWQLPWFGKGKTTIRGGYQATFTPIDQADPNGGFGLITSNVPGLIYPQVYQGDASIRSGYMNMADLPGLIPTNLIPQVIAQNIQPISKRPVTAVNTSSNLTVYDPNVKNPYIQSLTLSVTRNLGNNVTVDVRYIGTLSRKQIGNFTLDSVNFINNGLLAAFDIARAGGESPLLNQMILPNTLNNAPTTCVAPFTHPSCTGSAQMRASSITRAALARGNYAALALSLANTNGALTSHPSTERGWVLRNSGTAENFIVTNPQYGNANWRSNRNHSNYHSMQAQFTLRPTRGLSTQLSYTWSKNLGTNGATDPTRPDLDYGILTSNRPHNFTNYGSFDLPFGPNGFLFRNSTGIAKKIVEGWQLSWTSYMASGMPMSVTTLNSLYASGQPDLVRPDLWNAVKGKVVWINKARYGNYWSDKTGRRLFMQVNDPACSTLPGFNVLPTDPSFANSMFNQCNTGLKALASVASYDANGNPAVAGPIVFQMPKPGTRGNYDINKLMGPGTYGLDLAASKSIEFMEGKSINLRIDVQNVLNHGTPTGTVGANYNGRQYAYTNPITNMNDTVNNFGVLVAKGGHRTFSVKMRINF
jgi:hypothetical protein